MKILVIADEHGKTEVTDKILQDEKADVNIHLGDSIESSQWLEERFDYSVFGNNDLKHKPNNFDDTPASVEIEIEGMKLYVFHGTGVIFSELDTNLIANVNNDSNVYLFGHSHVKVPNIVIDNKHYINPGSIGMPRDDDFGSYAVFEIKDGELFNFKIKKV